MQLSERAIAYIEKLWWLQEIKPSIKSFDQLLDRHKRISRGRFAVAIGILTILAGLNFYTFPEMVKPIVFMLFWFWSSFAIATFLITHVAVHFKMLNIEKDTGEEKLKSILSLDKYLFNEANLFRRAFDNPVKSLVFFAIVGGLLMSLGNYVLAVACLFSALVKDRVNHKVDLLMDSRLVQIENHQFMPRIIKGQ